MRSDLAYIAETAAAAWLVVGAPVVGRLRYRSLDVARLDRRTFYRRGLCRQWTLTAAVVVAVLAGGGRPAALGLAWHLHAAVALAPTLAELVAVGLATVAVLRLQAARRPGAAWADRLLRPVRALLPIGPAERRWFAAVAVTAGITEEVLYRGVVTLWFVETWPSLGLDGAVVASSVAFGLAHAYQGPVGVVVTGTAGYAFGVMYVATGSLLLPAVVHALVDLRVLLVLPRQQSAAPALTTPFVPGEWGSEGPGRAYVEERASTPDGHLSSP